MTANELFGRLTAGQSGDVFNWFHDQDRPGYRTCVGLLANRRKLRPVFVERKPREERHAWMKEALARPANADLAAEIFQAWILGPNAKMVFDFLEELNISHDGKGIIENLPPEPPSADLGRAVENLFKNHPPVAVMVYLNLFVGMGGADWQTLKTLVSTDPRLCPDTKQKNI